MGLWPVSDTSNHEGYCKTLSEPSFSFPNLPLITCFCTAAEGRKTELPHGIYLCLSQSWRVTHQIVSRTLAERALWLSKADKNSISGPFSHLMAAGKCNTEIYQCFKMDYCSYIERTDPPQGKSLHQSLLQSTNL